MICTGCKIDKPEGEYHRDRRNPTGINARCKACRKKVWSTGQHVWRNNLRRYGVTPEQYDELNEKQGEVCAICKGEEPTGRRLSVDHCHETGEVRGLLCTNCNQGLGSFKEDLALFARAAKYIDGRWRG